MRALDIAASQDFATSLGDLKSAAAAALVAAVADLALLIDADGVIRNVTVGQRRFDGLDALAGNDWIGRRWRETVAEDSLEKIRLLIAESDGEARGKERQINHVLPDGSPLLVAYNVIPLDDSGMRVAVGKELGTLTRLQQRLVGVQQSMERDYAQLRQFETRYRLLFQTVREAVLVVKADDVRIVEANEAACALLGATERKLVGSGLMRWFGQPQQRPLEDAFATVRSGGKPPVLTLDSGDDSLTARLSLFKSQNASLVLLRLQQGSDSVRSMDADEGRARLNALVEHAPDALVVVDPKGQVLTANTEFLDLAQAASAEGVVEQPLANWLGQGGIDFQVIMSSVREHGSIRLYSTQMRGQFGSVTDVEVSATSLGDTGEECIGFSIRNISRRVAANDEVASLTPRSIDQLTQLVGRVPLKELVRESTELIEQLCIQAALKLTGNNRASAAELLGLSRQSLYVKLRRYSLADEDDPAA